MPPSKGRSAVQDPGWALKRGEAMLATQAHILDAIFNNLAQSAIRAEFMDNLDRYLKLALRAQSQCRATRLSCRKFRHNAVRLQLHALACNLGNFMRTLVLPDAVEQWSLTTLREKLVKIGAKIVRHGRYIVFQMAEVAIPRDLFADILRPIDRLRTTPLPTGRQDRPSCLKTTGPVCPRHGPTGNIECHHVPFTLNFVLSGMILVAKPIGLAL